MTRTWRTRVSSPCEPDGAALLTARPWSLADAPASELATAVIDDEIKWYWPRQCRGDNDLSCGDTRAARHRFVPYRARRDRAECNCRSLADITLHCNKIVCIIKFKASRPLHCNRLWSLIRRPTSSFQLASQIDDEIKWYDPRQCVCMCRLDIQAVSVRGH
jgi:hypothetical protein